MILITGARGHIGNVLIYELSKIYPKEQLRILVRSDKGIDYIKDLVSEIVIGDITNYQDVEKAVLGCEYVFHTAAVISLGKKMTPSLYQTNVLGTKNIIDACLKHGVKRLIYTNSVEALKTPKKRKIVEEIEQDLSKAKGAYAKTKILAAQEVEKGRHNGLDIISVYPSAVIGPRDYRGSYARKIISYYKSDFFLKFYFKGSYNFVDVRDVAQALISAMNSPYRNRDYILANQKKDIKEISKLIGGVSAHKSVYIKLPLFLIYAFAFLAEGLFKIAGKSCAFNPYSVSILQRNCDFDIQRAINELGFCPRELSQTIRDTVEWLDNNKNALR
ncbi:MAG TPA: NAD-dependent epimerase/dehydratase family protein [Clostridia bacterium]